jgi:hypothetical protein
VTGRAEEKVRRILPWRGKPGACARPGLLGLFPVQADAKALCHQQDAGDQRKQTDDPHGNGKAEYYIQSEYHEKNSKNEVSHIVMIVLAVVERFHGVLAYRPGLSRRDWLQAWPATQNRAQHRKRSSAAVTVRGRRLSISLNPRPWGAAVLFDGDIVLHVLHAGDGGGILFGGGFLVGVVDEAAQLDDALEGLDLDFE